MNYSDVYKNIDTRTIEETKQLIKNGFWKKNITEEARIDLCKTWLKGVSYIYKVNIPEFQFSSSEASYRRTGGGIYEIQLETITLFKKFSLVTLLHEFRHHLQHVKKIKMYKDHKEEDARAWSVSLFKLSSPNSYKKSVENGTLHFN